MFRTSIVVLAALAALACAAGPSRADERTPQVYIEARIAEVSAEFVTALGVAFDPARGSYDSTSNELPGTGSSTNTSGAGMVGGNVWFNTGLLRPEPGSRDALNLGLGAAFTGFFGGDDDIFSLSRHSANDIPDVTLSRRINHAVDVTARASIPVVIPSVGPHGKIRLIFEPSVGVSFMDVDTKLHSDRSGIGGPDLSSTNSEVKTGLVVGGGVLTDVGKVPILGDIPLLAGLFYTGRRVPGSGASVTAGGVTETGRTDSTWQHQALIVLVTPFIVSDSE